MWDVLDPIRDKYEEHNNDVVVRRYLTSAKFSDLVQTQQLHIAPATEFDDPLEGSRTRRDERDSINKLDDWGFDGRGHELAREARHDIWTGSQRSMVINCWVADDPESERMWKEYADSKGVAVETTVGHLRWALGEEFVIGRVRYLDFEKENIPRDRSFEPFFYKEKNKWSWENEIRAVAPVQSGCAPGTPRRVRIPVGDTLQRVIVSPLASSGLGDEVVAMLKRSGIQITVSSSSLITGPASQSGPVLREAS